MHLLSFARNPVPSGATAGVFPGYDGSPLRYAIWAATRSPRRGTVCLFQGRTEFIEKYFETISDLRRRGFAVAIMDWRGQGGSDRPVEDPRKGHIDDFAEYDKDIRQFMREVVLPDCPPPYVALGHSMGGHIVLRNIARPGSWFERAVLTAPMLALHSDIQPFPKTLVSLYASIGSAIGFSTKYVQGGTAATGYAADFEGNILTSDYERFLRNRQIERNAPGLVLGSPTIGWLNAAMRSMRGLSDPDYPGRVRVPALIFGAGLDRVVDTGAVERFAAALKVGTYILLPDARHEILQENNDIRARFWATFDAYLDIDAQQPVYV
ncbi:MAG: alpha/beta hydrolase [Alphaproteobacteria bacterium]|nr:alpha/beta hydrolase [Alphaproteobacteria bacterium]